MRQAICKNGHHFDADKYFECPVCGAEQTQTAQAPKRGGLWKSKKTTPTTPNQWEPPYPPVAQTQDIPFPPGYVQTPPSGISKLPPTEIIPEVNIPSPVQPTPSGIGKLPPTEIMPEIAMQVQPEHIPVIPPISTSEPLPTTDLERAVQNTHPIPPVPQPPQLPVAPPQPVATTPPVGWLVCVKGSYFGTAFPCVAGRNRIGRSADLEICLDADMTVQPNTHAAVIYDHKANQFHIQAGDGPGLVYLNDNLLFTGEHNPLNPFDKINIGETDFIFASLCGSQFDWSVYTKEGSTTP